MNLLLYVIVVLIWGTTWIALKWQLGMVPIAQSIAYRFALAALILFVILACRDGIARPRGKAAVLVVWQGLCLFCVNFICFLNASEVLPSGLVAVVFSTAAVWNALLARVVFKRPIAASTLYAGGLGLGGLLLLFWPQVAGQAPAQATLQGLLWALGGTLCFSVGNLLSSALQARQQSPLQTNAWGMLVGTLVLLGVCLVQGKPLAFDFSGRYIGALAYLAIPGSVIGFTAYLTLVGRLGPERAAYCTVLFPIVALNVSAVFESYHWSVAALAGLILVMLGNVVAFRRRPASA
jgi:drug/metabolite transporter (DMT)-like permease